MVCSASGSSSGLLGSVGQVPATGVPLGAVGPAALWARVRVLTGFGSRITASGTTLATDLLALSFAASAPETRAEKPFSTVYWWLTLPPERATWATSGACSAFTARTRAATSRRVAGSARCWLRRTTITRREPRASRSTRARESPR